MTISCHYAATDKPSPCTTVGNNGLTRAQIHQKFVAMFACLFMTVNIVLIQKVGESPNVNVYGFFVTKIVLNN